MPIYEYKCAECGTIKEYLEPMTAPEKHDCPECGTSKSADRIVSQSAIYFAGVGWSH